ncbi:MAG TPA: hypothetical protein VK447_00745 [Myxococcaceae bacterium]|nr:hypothetical protein [Myxococcaceae bacterium]
MKAPSRLLVIDADIARACGSSDRPPAPQCVETLEAVLQICHRVLVTEALNEEWHRHAGRNKVFMRWLKGMFGRKKVVRRTVPEDLELVRKVVQAGMTVGANEAEQAQVAKDVHLLAAALKGDERILSLDDRARRRFQQAASTVVQIAQICWVNPVNEDEGVLTWLEAGAPEEKHRQLGHSG